MVVLAEHSGASAANSDGVETLETRRMTLTSQEKTDWSVGIVLRAYRYKNIRICAYQ